MKILMTADTVGGVWTYAIELAHALEPHGVEIVLATMGRRLSRSQRQEAAALPHLHVAESTYKLEWMESPWADVARAGEWLLDLAQSHRPDLIHLNTYVHGALPWQVPVLMVGHSCVLSWWQAVKQSEAPVEWGRYRQRVTAGLRQADVVIAPTRAMLALLDHHYGPFRQQRSIPNARRAAQFKPAWKEHFIFSAGRLWDEAKNLAALEIIAPALPWPAYVAGETGHPDGGKRSVSGVQPLGHLSTAQMVDRMGRAAIYALPARYEPFGLSALEAGLCGCALVLGDIPTLREVWGDAALFVPPDDTEALADTLTRLIADPTLRQQMGKRALACARQYTPEKMGIRYATIYRSLQTEHRQAHALPPWMRTQPSGRPRILSGSPVPEPSPPTVSVHSP